MHCSVKKKDQTTKTIYQPVGKYERQLLFYPQTKGPQRAPFPTIQLCWILQLHSVTWLLVWVISSINKNDKNFLFFVSDKKKTMWSRLPVPICSGIGRTLILYPHEVSFFFFHITKGETLYACPTRRNNLFLFHYGSSIKP